jgi:hypothetical protein
VERVLIALALVAVAVAVATVIQRRRPSPGAAPTFAVPERVDRGDFDAADRPWLVVVFSARSCDTCAGVVAKARALESDAVVVQEAEVSARRDLHERYGVDAVPLVIVADRSGEVRRHFFGPVPSSDLWAAVASARDDPGPTPPA